MHTYIRTIKSDTFKEQPVWPIVTVLLLVANLASAKLSKKAGNVWNPDIRVLKKNSARAIHWILTWQGLDVFQKSLHLSAFGESRLRIWRSYDRLQCWKIRQLTVNMLCSILGPCWYVTWLCGYGVPEFYRVFKHEQPVYVANCPLYNLWWKLRFCTHKAYYKELYVSIVDAQVQSNNLYKG